MEPRKNIKGRTIPGYKTLHVVTESDNITLGEGFNQEQLDL